MRNVMEHAGRERHVERARLVRDPRAVEVPELGKPAVLRGADVEALPGDVETGDARVRQVLTEKGHRIPDAGAEIEYRRLRGRARTRARQLAGEIHDLVLGEVLGALARALDVLRMHRAVFRGELIELGFVHVPTFYRSR